MPPPIDGLDKVSAQIKSLLEDAKKDKALELLSKTYGETIYWHARRMVVVHEDAQDVLQETFIRIVRGIDSFKWESKLSSWIYRIAVNECLRMIENKNRRLQTQSLDNITQLITSSDYVDLGNEAAVKLQAAIQKLPFKQQTAFSLRYYDNLSYEEIADIVGSKPAAAKMNYHHAKEKILQMIQNGD